MYSQKFYFTGTIMLDSLSSISAIYDISIEANDMPWCTLEHELRVFAYTVSTTDPAPETSSTTPPSSPPSPCDSPTTRS